MGDRRVELEASAWTASIGMERDFSAYLCWRSADAVMLSGRLRIGFLILLGGFILFEALSTLSSSHPKDRLIQGFLNGKLSQELFTLPNGVNEFDLLKMHGHYYFAYDNKSTTLLRTATSIASLATAPDLPTVTDGRYPTILKDNDRWHLWAWNREKQVSQHYTSTSFAGPWLFSDSLPRGLADIHVRRFSNGRYFAAYKDVAGQGLMAGILVSDTPNGPWEDLGYVFSDIGRANWHAGEEADPALFEYEGKAYLTFAGWDGRDDTANQVIAIAEINPITGKAVRPASVLTEARLPWQETNSQHKLFNPVFMCDSGRKKIFYAQNVSASGIPAGWGSIDGGLCREGPERAFWTSAQAKIQ